MTQISEKKLLRFGCPACGIRLVVDQSIAGTEGPCPSCGARIIAPPLEVERSLTEKGAAPLNIKPRGVSTGPLSSASSASSMERNSEDIQSSTPVSGPASQPMRRSRSVSPTTALSEKHLESKNNKAFFQMLIAVAIVACIAVGVYHLLQSTQ